jgi:hypothetical protein
MWRNIYVASKCYCSKSESSILSDNDGKKCWVRRTPTDPPTGQTGWAAPRQPGLAARGRGQTDHGQSPRLCGRDHLQWNRPGFAAMTGNGHCLIYLNTSSGFADKTGDILCIHCTIGLFTPWLIKIILYNKSFSVGIRIFWTQWVVLLHLALNLRSISFGSRV